MKRSATSAYALALPQRSSSRSAVVIEIDGRDRIARSGLFFVLQGGRRRSVYQQFDGSVELADLCSCATDWQPDFEVTRSAGCKIDQHRKQAMEEEWRNER